MDHINLCRHAIIYQDKFSDIERFLALAKDHGKVVINDDLTLTLKTPPTLPPSVEQIQSGYNPATVQDFMNTKNNPLA